MNKLNGERNLKGIEIEHVPSNIGATPKDANTIAHEKVLRLEALKLAVGTRANNSKASEIVEDAKWFSTFVIGSEQ